MGFVHSSDDAQRRLHANARRACQAEPKFADCGAIFVVYGRCLAIIFFSDTCGWSQVESTMALKAKSCWWTSRRCCGIGSSRESCGAGIDKLTVSTGHHGDRQTFMLFINFGASEVFIL